LEFNKDITIDDYISRFPEGVQNLLQKLRTVIKKAAPDAYETINYGIPTFKLGGNLVHFAAFKNHIGFYPTPSAIEVFKNELAPYDVSKGTVKFPLGKPIPFELVEEIVKYRVNEIIHKNSC
jgi:uncharacterized protein YdhG (YjbR/CyaY superfamily)